MFKFPQLSQKYVLILISSPWNPNGVYLLLGIIRSHQISRSVVSDSLWPHESQHARPPCPSPTPGVHSDSRPSSQWCHPAISSSVVSWLDGHWCSHFQIWLLRHFPPVFWARNSRKISSYVVFKDRVCFTPSDEYVVSLKLRSYIASSGKQCP